MKTPIKSSLRGTGEFVVEVCLVFALVAFPGFGRSSYAADEFQSLVSQIPRSANAVVLLNMEKAKNSPLGLKEGWKRKVEKAFEAGLMPRAAASDAICAGLADRL